MENNKIIADLTKFYKENDSYAESAMDYLELAESALTKKDALKYTKKALELEPENLQAQAALADLTSKTLEQALEKYEKIIETATNQLTQQGYFNEDNIGQFYLILETRTYMLLRKTYLCLLISSRRFKAAVNECTEILRLANNDNMGIRYLLMSLYAYFEDEKSALELQKKYKNDNSAMFLLPLSLLFYKLGDLKSSAKYLKQLKQTNKQTEEFFDIIVFEDISQIIEYTDSDEYEAFTIEELAVAFQIGEYNYLNTLSYFQWAYKKLSRMK